MKAPVIQILTLFLFLNTALAQQEPTLTATYERIDNYLTAGSENGFSGAILVSRNGELLINKGYGLANKNTQKLNGPNTVFDIGSNTKQFTAAAILKLVEMEKMELTDPLEKYFTDLPADKQSITVHQLLSHSAGFVESIGRDFDQIPEQEFFETLFATELGFEPGSKYSYSNVGYSILGKIIELASGQSYEAFLQEYLFKPAGMKSTGYLLGSWNEADLARGYNRNVLESDPPTTRYAEDGLVSWHLLANGGINSTQNDMLLWYKALISYKVLSPASTDLLYIPHIMEPSGKYGYSYGWGVRTTEQGLRLSHNGSNGTFSHTLFWYPEKDVFITYATNANSAKVEYLAYEVAKILFDANYQPEPIIDNVYSYTINFMRANSPTNSEALVDVLKSQYAEEFESRGLFNILGNVLLDMEELPEWSLELFKLNVDRFPNDGNLWDSLAYGYLANGQEAKAIECLQKAISLGYTDAQEKLDELTKN